MARLKKNKVFDAKSSAFVVLLQHILGTRISPRMNFSAASARLTTRTMTPYRYRLPAGPGKRVREIRNEVMVKLLLINRL
ncbi:MAG: hypothetical protein OEZ08_04150 [Betaproteobacteria bacterium]|nr:hypothetical protein [Betaproteobacteria bacterium]